MRVLVISIATLLTGCHTAGWREIFQPEEFGVAVIQFKTKDGSYFPDQLVRAFPRSKQFQKAYPTLDRASSGVRLIEIKPLNENRESRHEANLSWSIDGIYLSYEVNKSFKRSIQVASLDGKYSKELMVVPKGRENFLDNYFDSSIHSYNAGLSWSKDSNRFTFMSNGGQGDYNIYVGAVGVDEQIIAESPAKDGYAKWSPVHNSIVFVSSRSGRGDIYEMNMDFKSMKRITNSEDPDLFPEWSPKGDKIVYTSGRGASHSIYVVEKSRLSGKWSQPVKLTNWAYDDLRPVVSPDGNYVSFYSNSYVGTEMGEKKWNIHVLPLNAGKTFYASDLRETIVAKDVIVDLNTGPAWSPDSQKIFYVRNDRRKFNPIAYADIKTKREMDLPTETKMNRDLMISRLGVLSFRAQVGIWDKVYVALTNQGSQIQDKKNWTIK